MAISTNTVNKAYTGEVKKVLNGRYIIQTNSLLLGLGNDTERVNYQVDLGDYDSKTIIIEFQGFLYYDSDYKLNMLRVGNFEKFDLKDVSNFRLATIGDIMFAESETIVDLDFSQMAGNTLLPDLQYMTETVIQTHSSNGSIVINNTIHPCITLPDHTQESIYLLYMKYRAYSATFTNFPIVNLADRTNGALKSFIDNCFNWSPVVAYQERYQLISENCTYDCALITSSHATSWLEIERIRIDRVGVSA